LKTRIAFDLSGLAWQYRTGVQNLYWAFVEAWARNPTLHDSFDIRFYDRSGCFNRQVERIVGDAYTPSAPDWWPATLRRPLQVLIRSSGALAPRLHGRVNHVWNWNIFDRDEGPASITIPDVLPLEHPTWFDARFRRLTEKSLRFAEERAEFVFAISHDVQQRICKLTGMPPERVRVVYPGVDAAYFSPVNAEAADALLRKHGLVAGHYLLSSGFLDPRKNLVRQLQAFSVAVQRGATGLKYALTGLRTSISGEAMSMIESPALRSNVVFLGYVTKADLIALTSRSAALMYCSMAEGFGLPIVEAMALRTQVITSATTSMQELASSRAQLVDPNSVDDIARAIQETLEMPIAHRQSQAERNRSFAVRFTIDNWLGGHLDAYASKPEQARWS